MPTVAGIFSDMDHIYINDLRIKAIIGVNPEERTTPQELVITLVLSLDLSAPAASDFLKDTIDYYEIAQKIRKITENSSFYLIERLAWEILTELAETIPVEKIKIRIEKPAAIPNARSAAVEMERTREQCLRLRDVYILLGSNIEKEKNMVIAIEKLAHAVTIVRSSSVYETIPVGDSGQPMFLNQALHIRTPLSAYDLKWKILRPIEAEMGRRRTKNKYLPRPIDLDIVLYDNMVLKVDDRQIPDPGLLDYAYVAIPVAEIAGELLHPVTGEPLRKIADRVDKKGIRKIN